MKLLDLVCKQRGHSLAVSRRHQEDHQSIIINADTVHCKTVQHYKENWFLPPAISTSPLFCSLHLLWPRETNKPQRDWLTDYLKKLEKERLKLKNFCFSSNPPLLPPPYPLSVHHSFHFIKNKIQMLLFIFLFVFHFSPSVTHPCIPYSLTWKFPENSTFFNCFLLVIKFLQRCWFQNRH